MTTSPIALVTGGSRGIGRSVALHLADRGADVILTYREREDEARAVVKDIEARGRRASALPLDVGRAATFAGFVAELQRVLEGRPLDYLVNNAGGGHGAPFAEVTEADVDALLAVHFKGPFFLTQKLVPLMADGGAIVNVTTGLTRYTYPGQAAYASVKGALEVLTRQLARELGPRRIAVNAVAPGGIATDFGGGVMRDPDVQSYVVAQTPHGRVGVPDDVGAIVALLVDPATRWMTGQRLELTGGFGL
ncbi:MAG: SDR family oxidoreductase [Labilithrix sp.]|nr:SDR family oxidoreductase [Labilithrix sp.]MCW5812136.1 SDR family oxidoreductase [Labilithrix sp.]